MKKISLLLALLILLSSCSIGTREQNRANEDRNKAELASNKIDEHSSAARGTKVPKAFIPKESKYALDESTEVLIDAPIISKSNIKNYYKHGDHWHIFTWDGKEYITYRDPAEMSAAEQANLNKVGKETEKYSLRQIVEHTVKIYEKNGSLLIRWKHIDHYHDSIYGLSEDIEGLVIEDAPEDYLPESGMEIPSLVANKRYFRFGEKIYVIDGMSQVEYKGEDGSQSEEKREDEHEAYSLSQIVANIEKIYMKKNLLMIKWLHIDHYHESAYGISEDIDGLIIEEAPQDFQINEKSEIPSSIEKIRYFRGKDRIYYISDQNKKENPAEKKAKDEAEEKKDSDKKQQNEEKLDQESDIPGEEVVRNLEHISIKSSQLILYWLHNIPGNPHYHSSIYGISEDVKNVKIVETGKSEVRGLEEIPSSVAGKSYYKGQGRNADTIYCVTDSDSDSSSGGISSGNGNASDRGSSNGGGNKDAEKEIPGAEIVANIEKIYIKNGLVILKWLHRVPGHEHYHESAIGFHEDIKNVKILDAPEGFVPKDELEIPSNVPGKKYYRGTGNHADSIFVIKISLGLFESAKESGDRVEVVYKGKKHLLFPLEYRMALKENRFFPNEESQIRIDPKFDEDRTIFLKEEKLAESFDFWATWKRRDAEELRNDGSTGFQRFRWYIVRKEANSYSQIEVDEDDSGILAPEMYELQTADDEALLKIAALAADEKILDEAKYLVKIQKNLSNGTVSEGTKEKIRYARKIFIRNGELSLKWWHINHWHFEPVSWHADLIIEKAPSDYQADPQKRIDELSLDQELLNRIYYIEEDRIYYVELSSEDFLSEKASEIVRRRERFLSAASEEERIEFEYGENSQREEILRFLELYEALNDEAKANLSEKKNDLENILSILPDGTI